MLDNFDSEAGRSNEEVIARLHIVVSNYKRLFCFVDNFRRIQGFDGQRDRVIIFDCSPDPDWREQLAIADRLTSFGLRWGDNLYFVRRRS